MNFIKDLRTVLAVSAICLVAPVLQAATTVYTNPTLFNATLLSSYTETFSSYGAPVNLGTEPVSFSAGGFAYNITYTGGTPSAGLVIRNLPTTGGLAISPASGNASLVINFTSGNITAVGGNFFNRDVASPRAFASEPISIKLTYSDSSTYTLPNYTASNFDNSFRGFVSPTGLTITQLILTYLDGSNNNTVRSTDNFVVGSTVAVIPIPESSTFAALAGTFALAFVACRRRK